MPVNPESEELERLLEENIKKIGLSSDEKDILREGLKNGEFKEATDHVVDLLKVRGQFSTATTIEEMGPLFMPHDFWDNQPVPKTGEMVSEDMFDKPIEVKKLEDVQKEPYGLPPGYSWHNVNLQDEFYAKELYVLLTKNYVEDDDAMFRFDYSIPFLKWALEPPG